MQELMIIPNGDPSFTQAMRMGFEIHPHLKAFIKKKSSLDATAIRNFTRNCQAYGKAIYLLVGSIKKPDRNRSNGLNSDVLGKMYKGFIKDTPIVDPYHQDDLEEWTSLTSQTEIQIQRMGYDDLSWIRLELLADMNVSLNKINC
ncbi:ENO [Lepeophtheirus salmonis]|uniref:phosphopyruvate hydratase n=1 Tax=Lepeophtheirus salmonis TaxID=72036 RepID=A0A7R8H5U5_LEPSM|nr:ENO [Lepeophtheirus salmonis]CAF2884483.1 ENO [Lepeophtheirus salmonis]